MPSDTPSPHPASPARLSDGKTAQAVDADVRLSARGISIEVAGQAPFSWPYDTLSTAEPLTAHAIDALLNSTAAPGATLFVADAAFARRLAVLAPHLTARVQRWRHARPWVLASCAAGLVAALIWAFDLSPSHAVAKLLPDRARAALGEEAIRSLTAGREECREEPGVRALEHLTERLSGAAPGTTFRVTVFDWTLVNAFAVPGEQIVVTRGLIEGAQSADEIAGVLAHEMGHGLAMDPETALVRAIGLAAAADLILGGSSGTLANIGLVLAQLSYTRHAERDADTRALQILERAGIAADGLASFFKRISELESRSVLGQSGGALGMLRTHPLSEERQRAVESRPRYAATPSMTDEDWQSLKAICPGAGTPANN